MKVTWSASWRSAIQISAVGRVIVHPATAVNVLTPQDCAARDTPSIRISPGPTLVWMLDKIRVNPYGGQAGVGAVCESRPAYPPTTL
jgi:hypothetical protein